MYHESDVSVPWNLFGVEDPLMLFLSKILDHREQLGNRSRSRASVDIRGDYLGFEGTFGKIMLV